MSGHERLVRGRSLAEQASVLKLKFLVGDLLALGLVEDGQVYVARAVVVTAPLKSSDLGLVIVRFSRAMDALSMSLSGWAVGRVADGSRLVGPVPGDADLALRRLAALGLDAARPPAALAIA